MAMSKLDFEQIIKKVYDAVSNRLRVDAEVTATIGTVEVEIDAADGDNIAISDGTDTLVVNPDGSINTNIVSPIDVNISASSGDSIKISDGVDDLAVNNDGSINTVDTTTHTKLDSLLTELSQKTEPSDVQNTRTLSSVTDSVAVPGVATSANQVITNTTLSSIDSKLTSPVSVVGPLTDAELRASPVSVTATLSDEPIKISGTENGQIGGTEYTFVNNLKQQILSAKDRDQSITYADFGTKNQRITRVDYTATSIGTGSGFTARKNIIYVLDSGKYKRTNITWSLI